MMQYKGKADTVQVQTDDYEAGDFLEIEYGDWDGVGFRYHTYGGFMRFLVVESVDEKMRVIPASSACTYRMEGDRTLEMTVTRDGFIKGHPSKWNTRVQEVNKVDSRSAYHKVRSGIEKSRN